LSTLLGKLLKVSNLDAFYGATQALWGVSFEVGEAEIVALIGGNGAGKTTTLRAISRLLKPRRGEVLFKDRPIHGLAPQDIVKLGIAHVPEGRRIFTDLTVLENLEMGAYTVASRAEIARRLERGFEIFPRLRERRTQAGGTLSGGEQQMLAMARALMQDPELLLLDEPSMGLSPLLVERVFEVIAAVNALGKTILLVEQNANMALRIAHRGFVLQTGRIALSGAAQDLLNDPMVRAAYLGE